MMGASGSTIQAIGKSGAANVQGGCPVGQRESFGSDEPDLAIVGLARGGGCHCVVRPVLLPPGTAAGGDGRGRGGGGFVCVEGCEDSLCSWANSGTKALREI